MGLGPQVRRHHSGRDGARAGGRGIGHHGGHRGLFGQHRLLVTLGVTVALVAASGQVGALAASPATSPAAAPAAPPVASSAASSSWLPAHHPEPDPQDGDGEGGDDRHRPRPTPAPALPAGDPCAAPGVILGTSHRDVLIGTAGPDVICGLGGDDVIKAGGGDDVIYAGPGDDTVYSGAGDDTVYGEAGDDRIINESGRDNLRGGPGDDELIGGRDADTLVGEAGNDRLFGNRGDDILVGGDGRDRLDGGKGTDTCTSGEKVERCEIGDEVLAPGGGSHPVTTSGAPAGTVAASGQASGVSVTVDSAGGIFPWDIQVGPARSVMGGRVARDLMASAAYDISVPAAAPAFRSATVTIPYRPERLGTFPAGQLRLFAFDDSTGFWLPATGSTVDTTAHTVTARVSHFSVYAALKVGTPADWKALFGTIPIRCTGTAGTALDVALVLDASNSMAVNDPANLRIAGAKQFVTRMRDTDRAGVVTFTGVPVTRLGLTTLGSPAQRAQVGTALDAAATLGDFTNIPGAVSSATGLLSADPGPRTRVVVLITDGQTTTPYDPALTTAAARAGIQIDTIGLGPSVDDVLLSQIAQGTGGEYLKLNDPTQLPALYDRLAASLVDSNADTDGDGISDCVEVNGAFVPGGLTVPPNTPPDQLAAFVTTDPNNPDTDGDTVPDGVELRKENFADHPELLAEYQFLVDAGLTTFYRFVANPTLRDTDHDFVDDARELLNGTDPRVPDVESLGVDGLQLPPDTLVQPQRYADQPAIPSYVRLDGNSLSRRLFNLLPIVYDEAAGNCVGNCIAVNALAAARPDSNGLFGFCWGPFNDCVTDATQAQDIVSELRAKQGIFNDAGQVRKEWLQQQAFYLCAIWTDNSPDCKTADRLTFVDTSEAAATPLLASVGAATLRPSPAGGIQVGPIWSEEVARRLIAGGQLVLGAALLTELATTVRECYALPVLKNYKRITVLEHPCEQGAIFSPGADVAEATAHDVAAILAVPARAVAQYASTVEVELRPLARTWYNGDPTCSPAARAAETARRGGAAVECDELPFYSTQTSGPGASLRLIAAADNRNEGSALQGFYLACPRLTTPPPAERPQFIVVPLPNSPRTIGIC